MNISDLVVKTASAFRVKAGDAISANDLVQIASNGKAYPVKNIDMAAVANCSTNQTNEASGAILQYVQIKGANTYAYSRQAVLYGTAGSIFTLSANSGGSVNLVATKITPKGNVIASLQLASTGQTYSNHQAFFLSNGNICMLAGVSNSTISYAILDTYLNVVKALTVHVENQTGDHFSATPLSGGGFALVYQSGATPLQSRLATFDNDGNAVLAPTTVWTRSGTSGGQIHRIAQLSSGDLAIAVASNNSTASIGLHYGVFSTAGVAVLAFTVLDAVGTSNCAPELSVMPGYFAIARGNGSNQYAFVFNNAGVQQGSAFIASTSQLSNLTQSKLINDGSVFWLIWLNSSTAKVMLTKIPTTGSGFVSTDVTASQNYNYSYMDAFYDNGFIVMAGQHSSNTAAQPYVTVINAETGSLFNVSSIVVGYAAGTSSGNYTRIIPCGDSSFILMFEHITAAATLVTVGKYLPTAIIGVAQTSAAKGEFSNVATNAGAYAHNEVLGPTGRSFDHSATTIVGNKGSLMNYGSVLKGF